DADTEEDGEGEVLRRERGRQRAVVTEALAVLVEADAQVAAVVAPPRPEVRDRRSDASAERQLVQHAHVDAEGRQRAVPDPLLYVIGLDAGREPVGHTAAVAQSDREVVDRVPFAGAE